MNYKYICSNNKEHIFDNPTPDYWCPICSIDKRSMLIREEISIEPEKPEIIDTPVVRVFDATEKSESTVKIENFNSKYKYHVEPEGPTISKKGEVKNCLVEIKYTITAEYQNNFSSKSVAFQINPKKKKKKVDEVSTPIVVFQLDENLNSGFLLISNYNEKLTYVFSIPGPTIDSKGKISKLIPETSYTVKSFNGLKYSTSSDPFKLTFENKPKKEPRIKPATKKQEFRDKPVEKEYFSIGSQKWIRSYYNKTVLSSGVKFFFANNDEDWCRANENKVPAFCLPLNDYDKSKKIGFLYNFYAAELIAKDMEGSNYRIPNLNDIEKLFKNMKTDDMSKFISDHFSVQGISSRFRLPMATYLTNSTKRYLWTQDSGFHYTAYSYSIDTNDFCKIQKVSKGSGYLIRPILSN